MRPKTALRLLMAAALVLAALVAVPLHAEGEAVSYYNDLRPVIQRECQGCHQPASMMGGLDLTSHEAIKAGGQTGMVFKTGSPDESSLVARLTGKLEPRMPMGQDPLADAEIDLFRRWVQDGGEDDTPASARAPEVPTEPPIYNLPPVVTAAAYSPDGARLAVGGYRELLLHNNDGSKIEARLLGRSDRVHAVEFTPDGKTLVAVGGTPARFGEVQVWDVASRQQVRSVMLTNDTLFGGALSPDGKLVAIGGADKSVRVIEVASGKELFKAGQHEDWVLDSVFGIDGKRIVTVGRDRAAKLADATTGAFIENVNFLREQLFAIARHPRRDYVLIGGADRVPYLYMMDRPRALRIADDSTLVRQFDEQSGPIHALAFSPDGSRAAVGGIAEEVPVYDTETGDVIATCQVPVRGTFVLAFRPDGQELLAAGFDGRIRLFDPATGALRKEFVPVPLEENQMRSAR